MRVLRSYVGGAWTGPSDDGRPVLDAVTGEEVARVSSDGIDLGAALAYGRGTGGPALRGLTFHQRAGLLKSLGQVLREHRPELYALSARTGATLADAKFDVDGGIGVLLSYASRARRELPNDTILPEGAAEPLGRGGTFTGQHVLTSGTGSRSRSTRSTSRSGARWRSSPRRSSPACPAWSSRPPRPRT